MSEILERLGFVHDGVHQWVRKTRLPNGSTIEDIWNEGDERVLRFFTPATPSPKWVQLDAIIGDPRQLEMFDGEDK